MARPKKYMSGSEGTTIYCSHIGLNHTFSSVQIERLTRTAQKQKSISTSGRKRKSSDSTLQVHWSTQRSMDSVFTFASVENGRPVEVRALLVKIVEDPNILGNISICSGLRARQKKRTQPFTGESTTERTIDSVSEVEMMSYLVSCQTGDLRFRYAFCVTLCAPHLSRQILAC